MKKLMFLCGIVLGFGSFAMAQDNTTRVDARQQIQHARIYEGRQSGELTHRETGSLRHEQRHIRRAERRARVDGEVTGRERARLARKQNKANRHIRRAKHNELERVN